MKVRIDNPDWSDRYTFGFDLDVTESDDLPAVTVRVEVPSSHWHEEEDPAGFARATSYAQTIAERIKSALEGGLAVGKYAVKYQSSSKGEVEIDGMATPHLAHAAKKMISATGADLADPCEVLECMIDELASRALSVKAKAVLEAAVLWNEKSIDDRAFSEIVTAYVEARP